MTTKRVMTLLAGVSAWACSGNSTQPPGPPTDLVLSGGDGQNWYFNNPLPTALSVTALDVDGRAVPGVVVTWSVGSGGGAVSPVQSTSASLSGPMHNPEISLRPVRESTSTRSYAACTCSLIVNSKSPGATNRACVKYRRK